MSFSITPIFDNPISAAAPIFTGWFQNSQFLVFESDDVGEYLTSNQFIETAVALYVRISSAPLSLNIERQIDEFQDTINTHDLIFLPSHFRNDCLEMRLLINPSRGFHCRILAISC